MTTAQAIVQQLAALPEGAQREVLDFVEFDQRLSHRWARGGGRGNSLVRFLACLAMRGMEDEASPYTLDNVKETLP